MKSLLMFIKTIWIPTLLTIGGALIYIFDKKSIIVYMIVALLIAIITMPIDGEE